MGSAWTTADYALIISLFSAALALGNFLWNIWSKFIFPKPRLEVSINFSLVVGPGTENFPSAISITAVNHGPIEITLTSLVGLVKARRFLGKSLRAVFQVYENYPYSLDVSLGSGSKMPIRLKVGEHFTVYIPDDPKHLKEVMNIGFSDGFMREHFAGNKSRRLLQKKIRAA